MEVGPLPVEPFAGVTHYANTLSALDGLAGAHIDCAEVGVQTIIGRAIPIMLDHDVFAVVGRAWHQADMNHFAFTDRVDFVQRLPLFVAVQTTNVDSFVKPRVNNPGRRFHGIAHKSVLTAFPWS